MFTEEVKKSFIAQGHAMAAHWNETFADLYFAACRNWAARRQQGEAAAGPEPVPQIAIEATFDFSDASYPKLGFRSTGKPVSDVAPSKFLPTYQTDENAIGFPVGGPVPEQPGRYYDFSSAASWVGRKATVNGKNYEFKGITPFNRAWVEV